MGSKGKSLIAYLRLRAADADERRCWEVSEGAIGAGGGAREAEGLADAMKVAATEAHITNYVNLLQQPTRLWDSEAVTEQDQDTGKKWVFN